MSTTNYTLFWSPAPNQRGWGGPPQPPADPMHRALAAHRQRDWRAAQAAYIEALRARPNRALAAYNLGVLQINQGMGLSSLPFFLRATLLSPESVTYQTALLYARLHAGDLDGGEALLADLTRHGPPMDISRWRDGFNQVRAGIAAAELDLPPPAIIDPPAAGELPDPPLTLAVVSPCHAALVDEVNRLGGLCRDQSLQEVLAELAPVLDRHPDWGEGHHLRGQILARLARWEQATAALGQASQLLPGRPDIWDQLGNALDAIEDFPAARRAYEHSLALQPVWHVSWNNAADAAITHEQFRHAFQCAVMALTLAPDNEICLFNFARASKGSGNFTLARNALTALLRDHPDFPGAESQFGDLCLEIGDHLEAMRHFKRALAQAEDNAFILGNLIFLSNYLGVETQATIGEQARQYGRLLSRGVPPPAAWTNRPDPERRLRLGFVSGDLRQHPVGYFFSAVVRALAHSPGVELFAYPTTRQSDALTQEFRALFAHWRPIPGLNDDEAAARVRADGIDLLVDLSGHTGYNRLGLFARQPAPVQVTWLGYFGTTGLPQIDYLLAGPWDVPPAEEVDFTETIWRLPHTRLCFSRIEEDIRLAVLPALANGFITFSCFNNPRKLTDAVVARWVSLLARLPAARLFLKSKALVTKDGRRAVTERFQAAGLDPQRLILEGPSPFADYLASYHRVDIALDPFPYTGGTTSIQALWMGVPVLTLVGDRLLARQGEAMLRVLGLDDWIATTEADYGERAVRLAGNLAALSALRASLRQRLESSPLMDAPRFALDLEAAFRAMWRRWCRPTVREQQA